MSLFEECAVEDRIRFFGAAFLGQVQLGIRTLARRLMPKIAPMSRRELVAKVFRLRIRDPTASGNDGHW
jgi:hypothetical protein